MEPVPSPHGARGFDPWRRHLRPTEAGASTLGARGFATPCSILVNTEIQRYRDTETRRNNKNSVTLCLSVE